MNARLYILLAIHIGFGVCQVVGIKAMFMTTSNGHPFNHSQFITTTLFLGEILVIFVYILQKNKQPVDRKKLGIFAWFAMIDIIAMQLSYLGIMMTAVSIREMLNGMNIVWTALFTILIVKNKRIFAKQKILGLVIILAGVTLVGLSNLLFVETSVAAKNPTLGLICVLIGQALRSLQITLEEITVSEFDPFLAVAIEGAAGFLICCIIMVVSWYIPCYDDSFWINGKFEDVEMIWLQLSSSPFLIGLLVLHLGCTVAVDGTGMVITKTAGAIMRAIAYPLRQTFVWALSLAIGWEEWIWLEFIGFLVFLIPGILIYNEVFSIKCLKEKSELNEELIPK